MIVNYVNQIGETSAKQYNSRLINMKAKNIYKDEPSIKNEISGKIKSAYVNKTGEYERTIKYYLEYKNYMEQS